MREFRDLVLSKLDVQAFMSGQGVTLTTRVGGDEYRFLCPFHDDTEASANINLRTGLWACHACGAGGSPIDFLMLRRPGPSAFKEAMTELAQMTGLELPGRAPDNVVPIESATKGKLTEKNVQMWMATAARAEWLQRWFAEKRGYTEATVERWQLGWDGQRVTIPIRDEAGKLVNVRRYRDPRSATAAASGKMIGLAAGMNEARLWPLDALDHSEVVLLEGEWDAMLMRQHGFDNALTVTSGAGIFKNEWIPLFADKTVTIIYDNDDAGRRGEQSVAAKLARAAALEAQG